MGFTDWIGKFGQGLLEGASKPETILGGLQLAGNYLTSKDTASDTLNASREVAQLKLDGELQILEAKHQAELDLMRQKAAMGGGGGGGSAASMAIANAELALKRRELAQQKALAKYGAMQKGKEVEMSSQMQSEELKQKALQSLLSGATNPLLRGIA